MKLDQEQQRTVVRWIEEGQSVSDIQARLGRELGLTMTYMEVRFLIADLGVKPKDKEVPVAPLPPSPPPGPAIPAPGKGVPAPAAGRVTLSLDQVMRPGALVSGKVTFSDGKVAEWYLDQMGRLGLIPKEQGYKPSQADLAQFQAELQDELARQGF